MAKLNIKEVIEKIQQRVEVIERLGSQLPVKHSVGIVEWFGAEMRGELKDLYYEPNEESSVGGSSRVDIKGYSNPPKLLLSRLMVEMFVNMANECNLDNKELDDTIDNFIIHEIVHRCQGMGEQAHRGLSTLAPNILHENDYEADAAAVLIQFILNLMEMTKDNEPKKIDNKILWERYSELIKSTIFQIHLFTLYDEVNSKILNNADVEAIVISFTRWERMCIWHFQYHRSYTFNRKLSIGDFQVLFRPAISFRNQYVASKVHLNSKWPDNEINVVEQDKIHRIDQFCFSSNNRWGIRQHGRWNSTAQDQVDFLFKGIFLAETELTETFFRPLLEDKDFLVGDKSKGFGLAKNSLQVDSYIQAINSAIFSHEGIASRVAKATTGIFSKYFSNEEPSQESFEYDYFISSPMSFGDDQKYKDHRSKVLESIEIIKKSVPGSSCYFAGERFKERKQFEDHRDSVESDWKALDKSKCFVMILPEKLHTSCFVEAGYAIAKGKPSIYFVKGKECLPFMLKQIDAVDVIGDITRVYPYQDDASLLNKIKENIMKV